MKITPPNYFQTPNDLVDHWLPRLGEAEVKVLLVIIRKTLGWHKIRDRISLSQLEKFTGLTRTNAIRASRSLMQKRLIYKNVVGDNGTQETYYELVMEEYSNISDQYQKDSNPSLKPDPTPVSNKDTQKKPYKKNFTKEPPTKPSSKISQTNPFKNSGGGFFECLKEVRISDKDKHRLSNIYDKSLVAKVVQYVLRPEFKPKGTLDGAIFYYCMNPGHMSESQKERELREQKAKDEKELKIASRREDASLLEKYCRIYLNQRNRDISLVRWFQNYIEFCSKDNVAKVYYNDDGFIDQIQKNLIFHKIDIPDWIKDMP